MLNVACTRIGSTLGPEYVEILFDMTRRNLPEGMKGRFICFTDEPEELNPEIEIRPVSDIFFIEGKTLWLKLNWVIVGPLEHIAERGLRPSDVVPYNGGPHPKGAKIISFPLDKPQGTCGGWVKDVWKIGGGTVAEIVLSCNVDQEIIVQNIRSAHARNARWLEPVNAHGGVAVIVAGGPSLKRGLGSIIMRKAARAKIFALNNVPAYLMENGIVPDAQILMDALPAVTAYVSHAPMERYYCSMCDPTVLDKAGDELVLWNPFIEGILNAVPDARDPFIGGGTTVGTRSIGLCYMLGYRKIHIYGLDSAYEDGEGHAYSQGEYASVLDVMANGKSYRVPPQLLAQAEEFQNLVPEIVRNGVELYIHGDGLIPDLAASLSSQPN